MEERQIRAIFINGSPRKNKNTFQMLEKTMLGAKEEGAITEMINLYEIDFKGCKSCFACKLKNAKTDGVCAVKDDLKPILERCKEADVLVLGSPVYFSYPSGEIRSFMERLIFPNFSYEVDENGNRIPPVKYPKQTAMIFTMNIKEQMLKDWHYDILLGTCSEQMKAGFINCETLCACDTYQFNDYSKYAANVFNEEAKRKQRDEHFPVDLNNAYLLGRRLVNNARSMR